MRSQEEIQIEWDEYMKQVPSYITIKLTALMHEFSDAKALKLNELMERAKEARSGDQK